MANEWGYRNWSTTARTVVVIGLVFAGYLGGLSIALTQRSWWGLGVALVSILAPFVIAAMKLPGSHGPARDRFVFLFLTVALAAATAYGATTQSVELLGIGAVATPLSFLAWYSRR